MTDDNIIDPSNPFRWNVRETRNEHTNEKVKAYLPFDRRCCANYGDREAVVQLRRYHGAEQETCVRGQKENPQEAKWFKEEAKRHLRMTRAATLWLGFLDNADRPRYFPIELAQELEIVRIVGGVW